MCVCMCVEGGGEGPGFCGCHIRVFQHTMFVHQRKIYNYYRRLIATIGENTASS